MAYLADGVFVGSRQPYSGVNATHNVPAPQHNTYDVATGQQQHEARNTEMNDIRGKLANINDNSSDYLKLLNRYHELESDERTQQAAVQTALTEGPDPTLSPAEQQKYTSDLTRLDQDISKNLKTEYHKKEEGNFFERQAKNLLGKVSDPFTDGAQALWKKASPVLDTAGHKALDVAETTWDKASPVLHAAWDKSSPTLYAVRDNALDGIATTWNHLPGHEAAEKTIGNWTDRLPFNNVTKACVQALFGAEDIKLDNDAVKGIQNDPAFIEAEKTIGNEVKTVAQNDPRYGKVAFDIPLSELECMKKDNGTYLLELGGKRGDMEMWDQARHFYDLSNPDIRQTWGVAGNEQTWLLRHCRLTGIAHVGQDGSITIDYTVKDQLDLSAHGTPDTAYDHVSKTLGSVWHGAMGAEAPWLTGNFTRTLPA